MGHEHYAARPHPEFVVLEIGPGLGALIVHTDATMHGVEIEISPTADDSRRSHKQVLERSVGGRPAHSAVFDQLPPGTYTLWTDGVARVRGVEVKGEHIAELRWPGESRAAA
jgi:hypothetical protein